MQNQYEATTKEYQRNTQVAIDNSNATFNAKLQFFCRQTETVIEQVRKEQLESMQTIADTFSHVAGALTQQKAADHSSNNQTASENHAQIASSPSAFHEVAEAFSNAGKKIEQAASDARAQQQHIDIPTVVPIPQIPVEKAKATCDCCSLM